MKPTPNLILHCGASHVSRDEINHVTPQLTDSWTPIPHHCFLQQIENNLEATKLEIGTVAPSLCHSGQRYFGLIEVKGQKQNDESCYIIGLRKSHDKTFPAGLVAGAWQQSKRRS